MDHTIFEYCFPLLKFIFSVRPYILLIVRFFSVPLPLLKRNDTHSVAYAAVERSAAVFLEGKSHGTKNQLIEIMTMLSGGHMRAMEHLVNRLKDLTSSDSVLDYVRHACRTYELDVKDIYGAVLLSLLDQSVPLDTTVRLKNTLVTVEDMVANGFLVDSITDIYIPIEVLPNMPLISLIRWAFVVYDEFIEENSIDSSVDGVSNERYPGLRIAQLIIKLMDTALSTDPTTGKIFESVRIIRHLVMRHVYKSLMEGNIIENLTRVDWHNATLTSYLGYILREGPISAELLNLTFDFTKPLAWEQLDNDAAVVEFFKMNYAEKRSIIGQPLRSNYFEAADYFICLVSNCGAVITIVVQSNFLSETSGTKVYVDVIEEKLEKAKNITAEKFGVPRNTIICVAELWGEGPNSDEIDMPMKLENSFLQTKAGLEQQDGPLMRELIAFGDLKNIYG